MKWLQMVGVLLCAPLTPLMGHAGDAEGAVGCKAGAGAEQSEPRAFGRYVLHGAIVFDQDTQLTWQRCSVGQRWDNARGCVGDVRFFSFDEAQEQGGGQWRVPTKEELGSLVDQARVEAKRTPTIDPVAFPNLDKINYGYWSSTPSDASQGWYVGFNAGDLEFSHRYRGYLFAVRLVCGEP